MPNNTEFVIAAYGIVCSVVLIYAVSVLARLRSFHKKLAHITEQEPNE